MTNLILAHPTQAEAERTWVATHPLWGGSLSVQNYLKREEDGFKFPLARDGGLVPWILTDGTVETNRPVLSSCETLRKRALIRTKDGVVKEGWVYGVASVFTLPEYRGKGYASTLLSLLGREIPKRKEEGGDVMFSVLFSDIGKTFYAKLGWAPFESNHIEMPVRNPRSETADGTSPISLDDVPGLAALDEKLLRAKFIAAEGSQAKTRVAILPDADTMLWHMYREDFMCQHTLSRKAVVRGAMYAPPSRAGGRVWALWTRGLYGGAAAPEKNTLYILRLAIEDEDGMSDEELGEALRQIFEAAQKEAQDWLCAKIEMWNPNERIRGLLEGVAEFGAKFVVREKDEISSLRWFGEGSEENVEWVSNEKYVWC
ncbi:hypothetical protein B0I35DRAFT_222531 [Stachybotrys elegans]|uniref:LYC1 C-terminal domain-containing protein n=1 Tax=Stachybotrys elegans TaxID=80388 RepID=A0A8K0WRT7_9HYPO|nr:hypothetical protein B0I35DRAFT_222531 [Stachybotrys elegans]